MLLGLLWGCDGRWDAPSLEWCPEGEGGVERAPRGGCVCFLKVLGPGLQKGRSPAWVAWGHQRWRSAGGDVAD